MNRRRRIYEGKAKILYEGPEPGTLVQHFKDDATAFNNKKHDKIEGKGVLNNRISEYVFQKLGEVGVPTHFIKRLNMAAQDIARMIKESFPDAEVRIEDLAGDGNHYAATVISEAFRGKSRVQQHQMVYDALKGNMNCPSPPVAEASHPHGSSQ